MFGGYLFIWHYFLTVIANNKHINNRKRMCQSTNNDRIPTFKLLLSEKPRVVDEES